MAQTVLVRGVGDVGSAVAHTLAAAGHAVLIHDRPISAFARRGMAFVDALFEGTAWLAARIGKRVVSSQSLPHMLACRKAIPICVDDFSVVLATVHPDILIDARMRKHSIPEGQIGLAPLTLGLGPNFAAGETVDIAIETAWGEELGRVIERGSTRKLQGEPRPLAGFGRERYVYAPYAGVFRTARKIGDQVRAGEPVGRVDGPMLCAPLTGCIRGLTHDGVLVEANTKVIEIDPRGEPTAVFGLGERPRRIAEGLLHAIGDER